MKIYINKSLLVKIKAGEPTPDVKAFESEGLFWIMGPNDPHCVELEDWKFVPK